MRVNPRDPSKSANEEAPDGSRPSPTAAGVIHRKKGTSVRAWLLIDATGLTQVVEAGKHAIMRRTGLPARDLRILDPLLSYPSTILGRERAMVINLEHIKAIITSHEVLLLNSKDPSVTSFVEEFRRRIAHHHQATKAQKGNGDDSSWTKLYELEEAQSTTVSPRIQDGESKGEDKQFQHRDGMKILPFEFVALEACLEAACGVLENEAKTLEQEAHPALDKLASNITTLNLERVRQIKSRLVAITGRVQKVRDELEHLLDDDEDMAEMYLTDKLAKRHLEDSSASSTSDKDDMEDQELQTDMDAGRIPGEISLETGGGSARYEDQQNALGRHSHGTRTSTTHSTVIKQLDVQELEMLLEAYFVQIDSTLNKLSTLRDYVDDTEDYINIMLDDKQNHLLQMGVMLTTATLVLTCFVVVCGVMGINIHIKLFETGMREFLWTVGGCTAGSIFLYVSIIAWCKHKHLLE